MTCARQVSHRFQIIATELLIFKCLLKILRYMLLIMTCARQGRSFLSNISNRILVYAIVIQVSVQKFPVCANNHDLRQGSRSHGIFWCMQSSFLLCMLFGELLHSGNSISFEYSSVRWFDDVFGSDFLCIHIDRKAFSHAYRVEWSGTN